MNVLQSVFSLGPAVPVSTGSGTRELVVAFLSLSLLEIALGIDHVIFISMLYLFAMGFFIFVEILNVKMRKTLAEPVKLHLHHPLP